MQTSLLLTLLKKLKNDEVFNSRLDLLFPNNDLSILLSFRDKQIQSILSYNQSNFQIAVLYLYLNNKKLPSKVHDYLWKMIGEKNNYILALIDMNIVFEREDALDFLKVVSNSKNISCANFASCSCHDKVLNRKDALNIITTITNASNPSECCFLTFKQELMEREDATDFIKLMATSNMFQYVYDAICNMQDRSDAIEVIKIVNESSEEYQAKYSSIVACDENVKKHKDYIKIVKIVSTTIGEDVTEYASMVACDPSILGQDNTQELILEKINQYKQENDFQPLKLEGILSKIEKAFPVSHKTEIITLKELMKNGKLIETINILSDSNFKKEKVDATTKVAKKKIII